ncbi:hypothetical protein N7532_010884 [Penicillium argentinense]|uniref:DUF7729 domain-containing protein n=1 Tax=Penicillium argentinense TaxID=1131581 RepID=A0A9W9JYC9_9EURO|nr:uncharacterized protein N7532_010884 [Penicillium argentinense]KAJ5086113.1 hypothetical protein N7532_010884 [Penicillium argentinense]
MEAPSRLSTCNGSRKACHSFAGETRLTSFLQRRWSRPGQSRRLLQVPGPFYHGLLILILILCFSPIAALAQPAVASNHLADFLRSAPVSHGETFASGLQRGSSPLQFRGVPADGVGRDDAAKGNDTKNDGALLLRRTVTADSNSSSDMPTPFDTISYNFANQSCTTFFTNFLSNSTITDCHAVSLLLENSNSFFHTLASAAATSRVLDITCSQPVAKCASILTSLASEMIKNENCGQDYNSGNSVVQSTYEDLMAYEPVYRASCLTNPDTKNYCFVDVVQNSTAPNDYNVYFVPLGSTLTKSGTLTCNQCLQATMDIFAHWATVNGQSLDTTYVPSAKVVNSYCGAGFSNANVTVGSDTVTAGAGRSVRLPDVRFAVSLFGLFLGVVLTGIF